MNLLRALTIAGRTLAGIAVGCTVLGLALRMTEPITVGVAAAFALLVGYAWAYARPELVIERRIRPEEVHAGEPANGDLLVHNPTRRPSRRVVIRERVGSHDIRVLIPRLDPQERRSVLYEIPPLPRGVYDIAPVSAGRSDPLGLVHSGDLHGHSSRLVVYPRWVTVAMAATSLARDLDGPTSSEAPQGGIAFHTLRDYVPGDDLRQIHWRSSARAGTLMVRHNVDTNQPRTLVLLDVRSSVYESAASFETALEVAASLVVSSMRDGFPVALVDNGSWQVDGGSSVAERQVLTRLAAAAQRQGAPLHHVRSAPGMQRFGAFALVVVSGEIPTGEVASIRALGGAHGAATIVQTSTVSSPRRLDNGMLVVGDLDQFAAAWGRSLRRA